MSTKAIIFDMDGVLVDSEHLYRAMNLKLFAELGATVSQQEYDGFIGIAANKMWGYLKDNYGIALGIPTLKKMEKDHKFQLLSERELHSFEGVLSLLQEAQALGYKMAVASSSPKKNIELVVTKLGIAHFFDVLLSGEEVAKGKPEPDIFLKAAALLGVAPQQCIVIEDSRNGAIAASKANIPCVGFRSPHSGHQDFSTCALIIDEFSQTNRREILSLFNKVLG
ncbi:MAG: HAD family hydrolase [Flammeovirgaceae bacterium]